MEKLLELFVKKQKENLTAAEHKTVDHLQADKQAREDWDHYQRIWDHAGQYKAGRFSPNTGARWAQMQQHMRLHPEQPARRVHLRYKLRVAAAAVLVLLAGLAVRYFWQAAQGPVLHTVVADEQTQLVRLSDGSQVRLYAGSRLTYPNDLQELNVRDVSLEGSAYFIVEAVPGSTFRVHTPRTVIDVLGTRFLVDDRAGEAQAKVEVEEGQVAFFPADRKDTLMLTAAHRGLWREGYPPVKEAFSPGESSTPPLIWKSKGHSLSALKQALYQQGGEQIVFPKHMGECTLSGTFDLASQYRLMQALQLLGYRVTLNDDHALVLAGDCP